MARILVVDDEESICRTLVKLLGGLGHEAISAPTAEKGLALMEKNRFDAVFMDVRLPGMNGLDALREIKARNQNAEVVVITAHGTMDTAIEAVQRGAFEYLTKPLETSAVEKVLEKIVSRRGESRESIDLGSDEFSVQGGRMVGRSRVMSEVYKKIGAVAQADTNVMVSGESGTGKELAARAIHDASPRREGPFEPVNCGALPETLLESELFGFEKGAFTGATFQKTGKFERATAGTLFLDEVGELTPGNQVKLLRVIQEREIERLGGTSAIPVDIRIISATAEPLEEMVEKGAFREDLYYRLKVVSIEIPPLRERIDDVELLVAFFLREFGATGRRVASSAMKILKSHDWPGNVRELRNAVEHAVVLSRDETILPAHLPAGLSTENAPPGSEDRVRSLVERYVNAAGAGSLYSEVMEVWERPLIRTVLDKCDFNQVKAAATLGINRSTLRKKIAQYGIEKE